MSIRAQIDQDLKAAMKSGDVVARDTLRMLKSALTQRELGQKGELADADILQVLTKAVKSRQESAQQYLDGGRAELADKEHQEITVVERYLPQPLSEEEAKRAVAEIAAELGASTKKDMGRVMKAIGERYPGRIDGKSASQIAARLLS